MAEKIISLRLQLKGSQTTLKQLDDISEVIREIGKLLNNLRQGGESLSIIDKIVKTLTKDFERLNENIKKTETGLGKTSGITAGKGSAPVNPARPPKPTTETPASLRREALELDKASARYKEILALLGKYKEKQSEINAELRQQAKEFEAVKFATGSYRDLNFQLGKAREAFRNLSEADRKGTIGQNLLKNIQGLDRELKSIDGQMGIFTRNVGNYQSALSGLQAISARFFALTGVALGANEIITQNARISDSIANVAKTANASLPEISRLADELEFRDTRTSLAEQLKIAEIGGQLGLASDELASFTAAVDVLNVALGDQFGGDVGILTDQVGRLRNTLADFKTNDVAGDILKLGNALNVLEADGLATAANIVEISGRLAGLGTSLGLSADEIIGFAATLDELNVAPERAATAIQKVLAEVARGPEVFAQFTDLALPEFTKLVNEDLVGAFTLVLKGINETDQNTTEFIKTLDTLGLDGERAIEVFAKLSNSTDLLTQRIEQSRLELSRTDSLYAEFTKKNATLGAELEKLGNTVVNLFTGSGLSSGIASFIKGIRETITSIRDLFNPTQKLQAEFRTLADRVNTLESELPGLLDRYEQLQAKTDRSEAEQKELGETIKRIGELTPTAITQVDKYGNAIGILAEKSREALKAEKARLEFVNKEAIQSLEGDIKTLERQAAARKALIEAGQRTVTIAPAGEKGGPLTQTLKLTAEEIEIARQELRDFQFQIDGATAQLRFLKTGSSATTEEIDKGFEQTTETVTEFNAATLKSSTDFKKIREEQLRITKEATENIQRLQLEALDKTFSGRRERLEREAEIATAALVGTPEQVRVQTVLIQEQLKKDLAAIDKEAEQARLKVIREIIELQQEIKKGQADFNLIGSQTGVDETTRFYQQQVQQLRLVRAQEFAELEKSLTRGEITIEEFERRRIENENVFKRKRLDIQKLETAELAVNEAELLQRQFEQREVAYRQELEQIERQKQERLKALEESVESGAIGVPGEGGNQLAITPFLTPEKLAALVAIDDAAKQAALNAEQEFLAEKDRLNSEFVLRQIERLADLAEQETEITTEKNEKLIELQKQYESVLSDSLTNIATSFGEFLAGQEKDSKAFLKNILTVALDALQRIILINVSSATAQSFAQPDSVATFGATGAVRAAVLTALITAGFQGIKTLVQQFEEGGAIQGIGATGEGEVQGPSHAQGGIKTIIRGEQVEIEGGEHIINNGPETYIINKKSSKEFKKELNTLHGNGKPFDLSRRMRAEQINTFKGFGRAFAPVRKFQQGGALSISPVPPPVIAPASREMHGEFMAVTKELKGLIAATNSRIDRLTVIANPAEILRQGKTRQEVKKARTL